LEGGGAGDRESRDVAGRDGGGSCRNGGGVDGADREVRSGRIAEGEILKRGLTEGGQCSGCGEVQGFNATESIDDVGGGGTVVRDLLEGCGCGG
jgi:hypothetical protein